MSKARVAVVGYGAVGMRLADGAALFLSGQPLPVVEALRRAASRKATGSSG